MATSRVLIPPTSIETDVTRALNLRAASSAVRKFAAIKASGACATVRGSGRMWNSRSSSESGERQALVNWRAHA